MEKTRSFADFRAIVMAQRVKDLRNVGFKVTLESNKDGLLTLKITKNEIDERPKRYIFDY